MLAFQYFIFSIQFMHCLYLRAYLQGSWKKDLATTLGKMGDPRSSGGNMVATMSYLGKAKTAEVPR